MPYLVAASAQHRQLPTHRHPSQYRAMGPKRSASMPLEKSSACKRQASDVADDRGTTATQRAETSKMLGFLKYRANPKMNKGGALLEEAQFALEALLCKTRGLICSGGATRHSSPHMIRHPTRSNTDLRQIGQQGQVRLPQAVPS